MILTHNAPIDKKDIWNPFFYKDFLGYESIVFWWQQHEQQFAQCWPDVQDYNAWFKQAAIFNTLPAENYFSFSIQTKQTCYEQEVFLHRRVPTRLQSWHDFFNNVTWILYPKTKWAIMQRMQEENRSKTAGIVRTTRQNLLAHFDECGMIFCSDKPEWFETVKMHAWKKLFLETTHLQSHAWPLIFGHGLFEKAQNPYIGMTGKMFFLQVEPAFFALSLHDRILHVDIQVAKWILSEELPAEPKTLSPFPMLGWPKWHQHNDQTAFYENVQYFRPRPQLLERL